MLKPLARSLLHTFTHSLIPVCFFYFFLSSTQQKYASFRDKCFLKHLHKHTILCTCTHSTRIYSSACVLKDGQSVCACVRACSLKMHLFVCVCVCEDSCSVSIKSSTTIPAMSFEVRHSVAHTATSQTLVCVLQSK